MSKHKAITLYITRDVQNGGLVCRTKGSTPLQCLFVELLVAQNYKARKESMNQGEDTNHVQGKAVAMEIGYKHERHRYRGKMGSYISLL